MQRIAIIDLGTNSVRFDVHGVNQALERTILHREKLMVRLGQNAFQTGKLDPKAMRRTLAAMEYFAHCCKQLRVTKIVAFGTSAIRDSSNGKRFVDLVKRRTGLRIEVISGDQEARLIAMGILNHEDNPQTRFALVDIGGGSTEISICQGDQVLASASFKLGTARLQEVYLKKSPPTETSIEAMRREIRSVLFSKIMSERWPKVRTMIGSSGTVKAFVRIVRRSLKSNRPKARDVSRKKLGSWVDQLSTMSLPAILKIPGLEPKRSDMILAGGILLEECMDALGVRRVRPTDFSLRDGILDTQIALLHTSTSPSWTDALIENYITENAPKRLWPHLLKVRDLSETLFKQMRRWHSLDDLALNRLKAAALLHDIGKAVHHARHGTHAYYVVQHADIPQWTQSDREFVARLCLHHADEKVDEKTLQSAAEVFEPKDLRSFKICLGLLQIADTLDQNHDGSVKRLSIRKASAGRKAKDLAFVLRGTGIGDLERLRFDQKKAWFEHAFKASVRCADL